MNAKKKDNNLNKVLADLLEKYNISSDRPFQLLKGEHIPENGLKLLPGCSFLDSPLTEKDVPLLTWRSKRKFIELKNIVETKTIEQVRMLRFCNISSSHHQSLKSLFYQEFDLCEFLGQGNIVSIYASIKDEKAANIVLRLDNDILCSLELSVQAPAGSPQVERHELVAERGVASDLPVDSQIPPRSIYEFTNSSQYQYNDTDMELYGISEEEIDHVRAAFHVLANPNLINQSRSQHKRLTKLIRLAFDSNSKNQRLGYHHGGTV